MAIFLNKMGINNKISLHQPNPYHPYSIGMCFLLVALFLNLSAFAQSTHKSNEWLKGLPDSIAICDINLPGSHDAAAINKHHNTPYSCHSTTIPEQLESGIRLLDIRIKVKGHNPNYNFVTCHGNIFGGSLHFNEYQSLKSVLDECSAFLKNNPSEFIIMMLKIDDWNGKDEAAMHDALDSLLFSATTNYPIYNTTDADLPALGSLRGKIYLMNRINLFKEFGVPIEFPNNSADLTPPIETHLIHPQEGEQSVVFRKIRAYPIYIQDQYKKLGHHEAQAKFALVEETIPIKKKGDGEVVLNYTTARRGFMRLYKVYIQDSVLNYFGSRDISARPTNFGWTMLDYESWAYPTDTYSDLKLIKLIISSNFQYADYPEKFKVLKGEHKQ